MIPCKTCLKFPICIAKDPFEFCKEFRNVSNDIYSEIKETFREQVRRELTASELSSLYYYAWDELYRMYPKLRNAKR